MTAFTSIWSRITTSPMPNWPSKRSGRVWAFRFGRHFLPMALAHYAYDYMRALLHSVFRVLDLATTASLDTTCFTAHDPAPSSIPANRDLPSGGTTSVSSVASSYAYDPCMTAYAYPPQHTSTPHAPATTTPRGTHAETDLHFHAYGSPDVCRWPSRDPVTVHGEPRRACPGGERD